MQELLKATFSADTHLEWTHILLKQGLAFLLGTAVAMVYRFTHGANSRESRALMATLVLLTLLIAMISSVIGDNVARAFSLVGALSIVRFRTVVEDTRDTAFVILAVGVGMSLGAGFLIVALILIPMAAIAAWIFGPRTRNGVGDAYLVHVRTGLGIDDITIRSALLQWGHSLETTGAATVRQGTGVEMSYTLRLSETEQMGKMLDQIQSIEGVASVEIEKK